MVLGGFEDDRVAVTTTFGVLAERLREDIRQALREGNGGEEQSSRYDSVTDMTSSREPNSVRD
jgi:hypothetical protein